MTRLYAHRRLLARGQLLILKRPRAKGQSYQFKNHPKVALKLVQSYRMYLNFFGALIDGQLSAIAIIRAAETSKELNVHLLNN